MQRFGLFTCKWKISGIVFDINFWNEHQRTTDLLIRTNNCGECWHRRLSSIIQCHHPTLCPFINSLNNEEHFIHWQFVKLNAGEKIEANKKYLSYSKRLRHLLMNPLATLFEQLDDLAHNLSFLFFHFLNVDVLHRINIFLQNKYVDYFPLD